MRTRITKKTLNGKSYVLAASAASTKLWLNPNKVQRKTFADLFSC